MPEKKRTTPSGDDKIDKLSVALARFQADMKLDMKAMNQDMQALRSELKSDLAATRSELRTDIRATSDKLSAKIETEVKSVVDHVSALFDQHTKTHEGIRERLDDHDGRLKSIESRV